MKRFTILAALAVLFAPSLLFSSEVDDYFFAASSADFVDVSGGKTFNGYDVFVIGIPSVGSGGVFSISRASSGSSALSNTANASLVPNQISSSYGSDYLQRSYRAADGSTFTTTYVYAADVDGELVILSNGDGIASVLKQTFEENPTFFNSFRALTSQSAMSPSVADVNNALVKQLKTWSPLALGVGANFFAILVGIQLLKWFGNPNDSKKKGKAIGAKEDASKSDGSKESPNAKPSSPNDASDEDDEKQVDPLDDLFSLESDDEKNPGNLQVYLEARNVLSEIDKTDPYYTGEAWGVLFSEKVMRSNEKLQELWVKLTREERRLLFEEAAAGVVSTNSELDDFTAELRKTHLQATFSGMLNEDAFELLYDEANEEAQATAPETPSVEAVEDVDYETISGLLGSDASADDAEEIRDADWEIKPDKSSSSTVEFNEFYDASDYDELDDASNFHEADWEYRDEED